MSLSVTDWYLAREGQQFGPITEAALAKFIELGHLQSNDLLWRDGFPDWRPAMVVFPPRAQSPSVGQTSGRRAQEVVVTSPPRPRPATTGSETGLAVNKVFVAGGQPVHTYVSRNSMQIEERVKRYLADGYRFLSLTGASRSGKSVLLHRLLAAQGVTVTGGQVRSEADFFDKLKSGISRGNPCWQKYQD